MKITKFSHCCMLIEEAGIRFLSDPGTLSTAQTEVTNIDFILITHEHHDHFDPISIKPCLEHNPQAEILTTETVSELLKKEGIASHVLKEGDAYDAKGVHLEIFGALHALIHRSIPQTTNIGFYIADRFFYPGDAFVKIPKPVEILALPVAGPILKISESLDYAIELKPKVCFPVHDGILKNIGLTSALPPKVLGPLGIEFVPFELGKEYQF